MEDSPYVQSEDELLREDCLESFVTTILDAKYEKIDIKTAVDTQKYSRKEQCKCKELLGVTNDHTTLFDATL